MIDDEVNVEIINKHIVISAREENKRKDWEESFKEMAANGDDKLVIPDVFNRKTHQLQPENRRCPDEA
jgi:hypothetical protein